MTKEPWQKTFLDAGSKEVGIDLSVLILTVRDIIDFQVSLQAQALLEKLEGEKEHIDTTEMSQEEAEIVESVEAIHNEALDRAKELIRENL